LTSAHLYRLDVQRLPARPTIAQERALIARARAGEPVRNEILLSLQDQILGMAQRFAHLAWDERGEPVEWLECVQAASIAILASFERALEKEDPYPYLLGIARRAIWRCIRQQGGFDTGRDIESLDAPLTSDGLTLAEVLSTETRLEAHTPALAMLEHYRSRLAQLLERLPEKQQRVLALHNGFQDANPLSFREIDRLHGIHGANTYHMRALATLKTLARCQELPPVPEAKPLSALQQARAQLGKSQQELADSIGVSRKIIRRIENGLPVRARAASLICQFFHRCWQRPVTPQELGIQVKNPLTDENAFREEPLSA
jgi:RNA polymerase sigma factor (sigma-70 family)